MRQRAAASAAIRRSARIVGCCGAAEQPIRGNAMSDTKKATLTYADGKSIEFPVLPGSIGPDVVDIRTLYGKTGMFTYDPGFLSTASCSSRITYIDGDAGRAALSRLPDRAARDALRLPRGLLPAAERRAARTHAEGRVRQHRHAPHHGARAARRASIRASGATRTRWR